MSEHTYPNQLRNTGGTTAIGNPIWECEQCGAIGQSFNDRGRLRCHDTVRPWYAARRNREAIEATLLASAEQAEERRAERAAEQAAGIA